MSATTALLALAATWVGVGLLLIWVMGGHGHDPFAWWLLGTLLGPLALPLAISGERRRGDQAWLVRAGRSGRGRVDVLAGLDGSAEATAALDMVLELLGPRLGRLTLATVTDLDASVEHARAQARARAELERQARLVQLRLSSGQHAPDDGQRVPALVLATGRPAEVLPRLAAEGAYDLLVSAAAAPGRPRSCWAAPRLLQKAMSLLRRGGTEHLRLSQLNFADAGPAMMRKLASDHQVASPQELTREMGVRLIPCQMTMDLLSRTREDMIDRLEEPAGVATALAEAQNAITLFI